MSISDPWDEADAPRAHTRAGGSVLRATASLITSLACVAGGSTLLSRAKLGTALHADGCDPRAIGGIGLMLLAGAAAAVAIALLRVRGHGRWRLHAPAALGIAAAPAALLSITAPAAAGCGTARRLAQWPYVGDALSGTGGIATSIAAALLTGALAASCAGPDPARAASAAPVDGLSDVEDAIDEAIERAEDPLQHRYRGVDSSHF